ncbi:wall-associated receptor kinase 4 [Eucalyptus grandis]|nr:wall-associated receptor kinase 4 [Eucalyptus grandis]
MKAVHWLLTVAVAWWFRQGGAVEVLRKCERQCGIVAVPFPFGLKINCARSKAFLLNCTNIEGNGLQLLSGNLTIRKISVVDSTMIASLPEAFACYDQNGMLLANESSPLAIIKLSPNPRYRFSETHNKLTVLGCDSVAIVANSEGTFGSGCISYCTDNVGFAPGTTCSGQGCCQASIPKGLETLIINISFIERKVSARQHGYCARAFVVDDRLFDISNWTLPKFQDVGSTPGLVVDWMVESDENCRKARLNGSSYACGPHTECKDFGNGLGYRCVCENGYEGNPYLRNLGCAEINECKDPKRYPRDGKCKKGIATPVIAASIFGITIIASISIQWRLKKINFRRNGGELLKQHKVRIFTEWELAKATNNYDDRKKLGNNHFGSVHKGTLLNRKGTLVKHVETVVVVKKPKDVDKSLLNKDFQRELEILMNVSCKNVVKLKGICLETRIPLLVYEYIPNGTLFRLIHQSELTISWEQRFKIAAEAALALNYMHSSIQPPIFHGNIKSANILLDQNNLVKISDFGTSVLISPEHRHIVATQKKDSLVYIDPEYLVTGMLTTQSDVYSFGVVLVELLTGKKLYVTEPGKSINTIHRFISSMKGDTLYDVINFEGASEDEMERVRTVAEIAVKCLDQSGTNRPAMSDVAQQLANINPSSTFEEENEESEREVNADKLSTLGDASQEVTSSCLSCLGMDSACSCI